MIVPSTDFLQGNAEINQQLVKRAMEWLELDGDQSVLELYSGIGNFSRVLAKRCKSLMLVEGVADMVERTRHWISHGNLKHVEALVSDLSQNQLPRQIETRKFDRVLMDPPRDGAKSIMHEVVALKAGILVYVSCNAATLARDAKVLSDGGYVLEKIALADMFPHTEHAECIACFIRKARSRSAAVRV
jgi:23S rRNA (uracil1939-C5)-methyltransferase